MPPPPAWEDEPTHMLWSPAGLAGTGLSILHGMAAVLVSLGEPRQCCGRKVGEWRANPSPEAQMRSPVSSHPALACRCPAELSLLPLFAGEDLGPIVACRDPVPRAGPAPCRAPLPGLSAGLPHGHHVWSTSQDTSPAPFLRKSSEPAGPAEWA